MNYLGLKIDEETLLSLQNNLLIFLTSLALGCSLVSTRPKLEMNIAAEAISAARKSNSPILSSALYRKAEFYYLRAKASYRRKNFSKAKQYALLSKKFSEEAEFDAIKKSLNN